MDHGQQSPSGDTNKRSLEDQLRNMILGNVTIKDVSNGRQSRGFRRGGNHNAHGQGPARGDHQQSSRYSAQPTTFPSDSPGAQGQTTHTRRLPASPSAPETTPQSPRSPNGSFRGSGRGRQSLPRGAISQRGTLGGQQRLYRPAQQGPSPPPYEVFVAQVQYLNVLASVHIPDSQMSPEEMAAKDAFRMQLESICRSVLVAYDPDRRTQLQLKSFGSFSSGFATKGSDMDLSISLTTTGGIPRSVTVEPQLLRALEEGLLRHSFGARLLTRTRVPILKVCQMPTAELFEALVNERKKWEDLPEDEKYSAEPPKSPKKAKPTERAEEPAEGVVGLNSEVKDSVQQKPKAKETHGTLERREEVAKLAQSVEAPKDAKSPQHEAKQQPGKGRAPETPWLREKALGPLDFPKTGVGIQSDINFSNDLALHNTQLLRCYCLCDPRVQPMVLFVKAWAKTRKINSSYSGTLSSYGYVLMILHFLTNVANPPVVPNLQLSWRPPPGNPSHEVVSDDHLVQGYDVRFWNDEAEIKRAAAEGKLSSNQEPLGALLRNFFQFYASTGLCFGIGRGFNWTQEVLSLRTPGGITFKSSKGWTGAKTIMMNSQEVRNRYLFAIEDPFEIEHNVARTVTHRGIVAIRDEFRRAWRIVNGIKVTNQPTGEDLFAEVHEQVPVATPTTPIDAVIDETFNENKETKN